MGDVNVQVTDKNKNTGKGGDDEDHLGGISGSGSGETSSVGEGGNGGEEVSSLSPDGETNSYTGLPVKKDGDDDGGSNFHMLAGGISIAVIIVIFLIVLAVFCYRRKMKKEKARKLEQQRRQNVEGINFNSTNGTVTINGSSRGNTTLTAAAPQSAPALPSSPSPPKTTATRTVSEQPSPEITQSMQTCSEAVAKKLSEDDSTRGSKRRLNDYDNIEFKGSSVKVKVPSAPYESSRGYEVPDVASPYEDILDRDAPSDLPRGGEEKGNTDKDKLEMKESSVRVKVTTAPGLDKEGDNNTFSFKGDHSLGKGDNRDDSYWNGQEEVNNNENGVETGGSYCNTLGDNESEGGPKSDEIRYWDLNTEYLDEEQPYDEPAVHYEELSV